VDRSAGKDVSRGWDIDKWVGLAGDGGNVGIQTIRNDGSHFKAILEEDFVAGVERQLQVFATRIRRVVLDPHASGRREMIMPTFIVFVDDALFEPILRDTEEYRKARHGQNVAYITEAEIVAGDQGILPVFAFESEEDSDEVVRPGSPFHIVYELVESFVLFLEEHPFFCPNTLEKIL
jgi:hypothetical protein